MFQITELVPYIATWMIPLRQKDYKLATFVW